MFQGFIGQELPQSFSPCGEPVPSVPVLEKRERRVGLSHRRQVAQVLCTVRIDENPIRRAYPQAFFSFLIKESVNVRRFDVRGRQVGGGIFMVWETGLQ